MMRIWLPAVLIFLTSCGGETPAPNFVIFTIDTLRADHLGCYGNRLWNESPTPVPDRLAASGILFERCYAPRGQTHPSLASMLTGKYPITHRLRENGQGLDEVHWTVVELLRKKGYYTAGFAANLPVLEDPFRKKESPPAWWTRGFDECGDGFGERFRKETVQADIQEQWRWDERVEKKTLEWIEGFDTAGGPFLLWTHFYDPHKPYVTHETYPDLFPDYRGPLEKDVVEREGKRVDMIKKTINKATRKGTPLNEKDQRKLLAYYDASVYGASQRFDRLLAALETKGMLENTWILFTSDHGEELGDHRVYYYHDASIYNAVLHIPLIVVGPGVEAGRRSSCLVQNVDMAPTLLALAGLEIPADMEGISFAEVLTSGADGFGREHVIAEWQKYIYSISDGRFKYIFNPMGACPVKPPYLKWGGSFDYDFEELYLLDADPGERNNVRNEHGEVVAALKKKLTAWVKARETRDTGKSTGSSAVEALGYTGAGGKVKDVKFKKRR
jgi:arylsulfatase A-like enzyme